MDRIQRMIDDEAAERFPAGAVPRLVLLYYGDHPVIGPGELYLRVILGQDGADAGRLDARTRTPAGGLPRAAASRGHGIRGHHRRPQHRRRRPTAVMKMDGISLLDPEEGRLARGLTPVMALLGPVDLATLDALITAGIAASRAEGARWAMARIRGQPAYATLSERAREPGEPQARAGLDRAVRDQLQSRLDEQVKEQFPDGGVQRIALLQYGDDPWVEPETCWSGYLLEEAAGRSAPSCLGTRPRDDDAANSTASLRRTFPRAATSSSASPRTAAKAGSCRGLVAHRTIQPGARGSHPG